MNVKTLMAMSVQSRIFALTNFTLGRMGVPLFLFLTGYLLLDRIYDAKGCYHFWKKNWLGMLLTTEVWIVIYDIFLRVFHFQHWSNAVLLKDMFFLTQVHMGHMWYMPMIIGLYLCIPFAARALKGLPLKTLAMPLLLLGVYAFGVGFWNQVFGDNPGQRFVLELGYVGGVYGIYLIMGFLIKKGVLHSLATRTVWLISVLFFMATLFCEVYAYNHGRTYNVWYNCGLLLLSCWFLFEGISRISIPFGGIILTWISRNSFGIYLIHFPFIVLLRRHIGHLAVIMPMKVVLLFVSVLVISMFACVILGKFKITSRILLYSR